MRRPPNSCERFETAAGLVARRWTPLVLRALQNGPVRYSVLKENLGQVSERMLIQRLKELQSAGLVGRNVSVDEHPVRVDYELTEKGRALSRVIGGLERWAEQWIPATATATATK